MRRRLLGERKWKRLADGRQWEKEAAGQKKVDEAAGKRRVENATGQRKVGESGRWAEEKARRCAERDNEGNGRGRVTFQKEEEGEKWIFRSACRISVAVKLAAQILGLQPLP